MEVTAVAISLLCQSCGCRGGRQGWAAFIPQHGLVPRAGVVPISAHLSLGKPPHVLVRTSFLLMFGRASWWKLEDWVL